MNRVSLKWKILIIGTIPFIFFLISSGISLKGYYSSYHADEILHDHISLIKLASSVVHETQSERGTSVGYLSGALGMDKLKAQKLVNDEKIKAFLEFLPHVEFTKEYKANLVNSLDKVEALRMNVLKPGASQASVVAGYTDIVLSLLQIELDVADSASIPAIASEIRGVRILEDAKESGGKFRAVLTSLLSKDEAISEEMFSKVISLKAGIDKGVESSGLVMDKKSFEYIEKFKKSKEWQNINNTFNYVLHHSEHGNFNKDANTFYDEVTVALGILRELIDYQKKDLTFKIEEEQAHAYKAFITILVIISVLSISLFVLISKMTKSITLNVRSIIDTLESSSYELERSSDEIAQSSIKLSESSVHQASYLQETVSAVDEINSMIQRNASAANSSTESSEKSKAEVLLGRKNISEMLDSIGDIASSNEDIMNEISNNNLEISKITGLIQQISEKTKVINDIVFQTKLLSFNASVEAARAGENGKGFSVVAEEVGNLAQMSGNAALEISTMLDSSVDQVNSIIEVSKAKIDKLVSLGKQKVENGNRVAHLCSDSLEIIMTNVDAVNDMVKEISNASGEQAIGVQEVTEAMQELDNLTHQNSGSSQAAAVMAKQLNGNVQTVNSSVSKLLVMIDGNTSKKEAEVEDEAA